MYNLSQPTANNRGETLGANTATSLGVTVTASATANTVKGTWVSLGTTGFDWHSATVYIGNANGTGDFIVDIGIDEGGNKWVVVPDLRMSNWRSGTAGLTEVTFPLHLPAGAALYARSSSSTGSLTCSVYLHGRSGNPGGSPGCSRVVSLYSPSTSRGAQLDPGGTAHTKGSYVQLTTGVGQQLNGWFGILGNNGSATRSSCSWLLDVAIGTAGGGTEQVIEANLGANENSTDIVVLPVHIGPFGHDIPPSTALCARAQCTITTATNRVVDLALYGLVA
jgi:hypothetical protein